jgi:flagellar protein FliL
MSDAPKVEKKAAAPKKKGGSKKKLFMGLGAVVLVLAGSGYWFMGRASAAPQEAAKADDESGDRALLAMEPFVVNLADEGGTHFLRTNIQLIIDAKKEEAKLLQEEKVETMPLRSAILELLSQQKSATLVTPEGKEALKEAIKKRATEVFKKHKVREVLFAEFVVQF